MAFAQVKEHTGTRHYLLEIRLAPKVGGSQSTTIRMRWTKLTTHTDHPIPKAPNNIQAHLYDNYSRRSKECVYTRVMAIDTNESLVLIGHMMIRLDFGNVLH